MYRWFEDNIEYRSCISPQRLTECHCEPQLSICSVPAQRRHVWQTASFINRSSPAACGRQCAQEHTHARRGRTGRKNTLTGTAWRRASRSAGGALTRNSGICPTLEEVNTQHKLACFFCCWLNSLAEHIWHFLTLTGNNANKRLQMFGEVFCKRLWSVFILITPQNPLFLFYFPLCSLKFGKKNPLII